jgi:hypothetical protein
MWIHHGGRRLAELGEGICLKWVVGLNDNLVRVVGDDTATCFWSDMWLEVGALCHRFRHLFDLAENTLGLDADMRSLG